MENAINMATDGRYSEFSDVIKSAMKQKMAAHDITATHAREFDRIKDLKSKFAEIADISATHDSPANTDEDE